MAKYAELPDGTRLEFPDDTQDSVIDSVVKKHLGVSPTGGIVESAIGSAKRGMISAGTALKAPFGAEEAAKAGIEAEQAVTERPGFNWEEIKRKYEQEGLMPAAGEAISQIPGTVSEQAPTLASILAGGRIGAMGGGALAGPLGATIGGIGGAALYPFLTQSGENIQRQYQEQVAKGETPDISLGKAYGAGAGQAALEMIGGPEAFLAKRLGKKTAEQIGKEELESLAKQGMVQGALRGTGRVMAEEIPTEIAQTALTRLQAGLPISPSDQQALDEYLASGVGAALAGPVGGPMRIMESGAARATLAEQEQKEEARFQNIAQNIYPESGLSLRDLINQNIGIQEGLSEKEKKAQDNQYLKDINSWLNEDSGERATLPDGTEKLLTNHEAYLRQHPVDADLSKQELAEKVLESNKQIEDIQAQGQQQIPGLEQGPATSLIPQRAEPEKLSPEVEAVQSALNTYQANKKIPENRRAINAIATDLGIKGATLKDTISNLENHVAANKPPVQEQLFTPEGQLSASVMQGYEQRQKATEAMGKKLAQTQPGETLDLFDRPTPSDQRLYKQQIADQNMRLFGTPTAPEEFITPEGELPSQGGSANLMMQQAIKEAEKQTAIDQANRARQTLYGQPEAAPMGYESAESRARTIAESLPHQQRALELQQQLQQQALAEQQKKAGEAMGKKLEQAKPGQTLDIFGKAHEADFTQPEVAQEIPSQGGSANLQIQEAIRQAELANDIEKANRLRQQLYATPEGQLLTPRQQQERIESEPFRQAAEQKAADLKAAKEGVAFSKATTPTNAHTEDSLQQALTKRYGNNVPKVNIGTRADVDGDATVQGFYDPATKSVTLIPENIDQSKDLHGLIRHEVAVHAKRLGKTDAEFQSILKQLNALKNNKAVKEAYARVPKDTAAENIDEEALGYLVEHAKQLPIVKRFMSWLRRMAHKLTGSSNWLRADDFAKLADEVLSSKTSTETPARAKLAPLYSKAQQRRAFDRPQTDVQSSYSVQSIKDRMNVKTDFEKGEIFNGVRSALNNIRKAAAYQQAPIASKDYDKYLGQVQDANGKATSTAMIDSALDSDKIAANAYDTGKVVVDSSGVLKVVADKNNLDNLYTKVANFAKSIGDEEHGKNIVNRYLIARRYNNIIKNNADLEKRAALETNKAQAKKLREGIVKVTPEQAQETAEFIDLNKTYPQLNSIADMVDAIQMDLLDLMEKTGIVSKKNAEKYRSEKGYVPLYRIMDDLEKSNPGVKQYFGGLTDIGTEKAFHGSDRQALDVLDNIMARYSWAVQASSRNAALNRVAESYGVVGDDGKTKIYHSTPKVNPEFFIPMMQDGKKVWVEYADPSIPQALLPVQSIVNPLFTAMGTASRILRTGVTALPTFGAAQVIMDAQRAALFSGVKNPFKLMSRVLTAYYDILKDPKFSTVERLHAYGISGGYGHTAEETNKRLRRKAGLDVTTKWNKLMDGADKFAAASDMAQRVAIYEQTMKETGDEMLALHRARNIINWRHRGDNAIVNTLTQIIPFANAYAQSMDVSLNAMMSSGISGKERKKAIKSFIWNTGMFMGLSTVYAMTVAGNDEYEKLSDREKLGSFFIPGTSELTGGNGSITIPVPNDIGFMFKILPELLINYVNKDSVKYPKDATKLASALGSSALDAITGPNLMPQAIKGVVEIATNHDFMTGNPIIGHGLERLEKFKQFTDSTSEVAKLLGKTNMISPMDADHLIKAYSGTIGSLGLLMIDKVVNQFSDNPKPETHLYKNPMVSRFLADPRYKSQIADYYDLLERSDKVTNTLKKIKEQDSPEELAAYKEENKELLQTRQQVLNLQNQVSKIREQRNKIRDNKSLSAEEKSDKIEALDERTGRVLRNIEKLRIRAGL